MQGAKRAIRRGFTLIEVLIAIALLTLVLLALYHSLDMMRASNTQLFSYLKSAKEEKQSIETLYLDIAGASGKIVIEDEEFGRLCIEKTANSLYGLTQPKVCWVVAKEDNMLVRSEGGEYTIPLESEARTAVDRVMKNIELFHVYKSKNAILVVLRQKGKEAISFLVQGIPEEQKPQKTPNNTKVKSGAPIPTTVIPSKGPITSSPLPPA